MRNNFNNLYTAAGAKALEDAAVRFDKLGGGELMERAGEAAYRLLRFVWPRARKITIVCGSGNNGGDGYVVARKLHEAGLEPNVVYLGDLNKQPEDAQRAREKYQLIGKEIIPFLGEALPDADIIVDALLGIGAERPLRGRYSEVVSQIEMQWSPVLAIDLPSGINSDTGSVLGGAVRAQATISFIGIKQGLLTGAAVDYIGELYVDDLAITSEALNTVTPSGLRITETECRHSMPIRKRGSHKSEQGSVLVVGGISGMTGAACLTAEASLQVGAGIVRAAIHPDSDSTICWTPELMVNQISKATELGSLLENSDVLVVGPGLGQGKWSYDLFNYVLEHGKSDKHCVLDADALNCLAAESSNTTFDVSNAVLTPHPGEAARLLNCSTEEIQSDRFAAANAIAEKYNSICVLKGAGTIVSNGKETFVCDRGHPAMATAGTGDILAGVIGGLIGQGCPSLEAAKIGVYVHAVAGEQCARELGVGMKASDLLQPIAKLIDRLTP